MNEQNHLYGHLAAGFSIFVWGTTFISTKVLLEAFTPLEILFFRFLIGYAALWLACPPPFSDEKQKAGMPFRSFRNLRRDLIFSNGF